MKKIILLLALLPTLASCNPDDCRAKVIGYHMAYQTSEVQEYTHDVKVAELSQNRFIEVPNDYKETTITIRQTGKITYFYIYDVEDKVSDKGWKLV